MTGDFSPIPEILIRPAGIADVYAIARTLRPGDRAEVGVNGKEPRWVLRMSFRISLTPPQVALVDDEPAAIWGLGGDILSDTGAPWLLTTAAVERVPVTFLKLARRELAAMLAVKPRLENYVLAEYAQAVRFLQRLGFTLDPPAPIGRRQLPFRRFWIER